MTLSESAAPLEQRILRTTDTMNSQPTVYTKRCLTGFTNRGEQLPQSRYSMRRRLQYSKLRHRHTRPSRERYSKMAKRVRKPSGIDMIQ